MTSLIAAVRSLTGVTTDVLDDDAVQTALDQTREYVRGELLLPLPSYAGGTVSYYEYAAREGAFESDVKLLDAALQELTPTTSDVLTGRWTFSASVAPPVFLYGRRYDLNAAAALVLEAWAAHEALSFDVDVDGQSLKRSQKAVSLRAQAKEYWRLARPRLVRVERDDVT
jgi:hypothetical protein